MLNKLVKRRDKGLHAVSPKSKKLYFKRNEKRATGTRLIKIKCELRKVFTGQPLE